MHLTPLFFCGNSLRLISGAWVDEASSGSGVSGAPRHRRLPGKKPPTGLLIVDHSGLAYPTLRDSITVGEKTMAGFSLRTIFLVTIAVVLSGSLALYYALDRTAKQNAGGMSPSAAQKQSAQVRPALRMPVVFEENQGQTEKSVRFLARARGFNLFLTADEAVLALARPPRLRKGEKIEPAKPGRGPGIEMAAVRLRFDGANPNMRVAGGNRLKGSVNDYRGRDHDRWHPGIPTFGAVHYRDIHPGIDLRFTAKDSTLAYSVLVRPGADPGALAISFVGAVQLALNGRGDLLVDVAGQSVRLAAPRLYQWRNGRRATVTGGYALKGATVRFNVGQYDPAAPLYIDPEISFSAYLYGSAHEGGLPAVASSYVADALGLAAHGAGGTARAYIAGGTQSSDFPAPGTTSYTAGWDAFVLALDVSGPTPVPIGTTYLGGSGHDAAAAIAIDDAGMAYVVGHTASGDFPVAGAAQPLYGGGGYDAFLARLNPDLTLASSSYFGGAGIDLGHAVAVVSGPGPAVGIYVAGASRSPQMQDDVVPLRGYNSFLDAYVTKFDLAATQVKYFTYLGGPNSDEASAIAVRNGAAYITGYTHGGIFPNINGLQLCASGLTPQNDGTCPELIPSNPVLPHRDALVAKINAAGDAVVFASRLGGDKLDEAFGIAVDEIGRVYIAGTTASGPGSFPTKGPAIDDQGASWSGPAFFAVLAPDAPFGGTTPVDPVEDGRLIYAASFGGLGQIRPQSLVRDAGGVIYLGGFTYAGLNFAATPPFNGATVGGFQNAFMAALAPAAPDAWSLAFWALAGGTSSETIGALALGPPEVLYAAGYTASSDFDAGVAQQGAPGNSGGDLFLMRLGVVPPPPGIALSISKTDGGFDPVHQGDDIEYEITISNGGPGDATGVVVTDNLPPGVTFIGSDPPDCSLSAGTVTCPIGDIPANAAPATITVTINAAAPTLGSIENQVFVAANEPEMDSTDNNATETTQVLAPQAVLTIVKTGTVDLVTGAASYDITVTNTGPPPAMSVQLFDTPPAGFTIASISTPLCLQTGAGTVECGFGDLNPFLPVIVTIEGTVSPLIPGAQVCNAATVSAANADPAEASHCIDIATESTALLVEKQAEVDFEAGTLNYQIFVSNTDGPAAANVRLSDTLPAGLVVTGLFPTNCGLQPDMVTVTCELGTLAAGAGTFATIDTQIETLPPSGQTLCNTVTVGAANAETVADTICTQAPPPTLVVNNDAPAQVLYATAFLLLVKVRNTGLNTAPDTTLQIVTSPAKLIGLSGDAALEGDCAAAGPHTVSCQLGDILPGQTVSVAIPAAAEGVNDQTGVSTAVINAQATSGSIVASDADVINIAAVSSDLSIPSLAVETDDGKARIEIAVQAAPSRAPHLRVDVDLALGEQPFGGGSAFASRPDGASQPCVYADEGQGRANVFCSMVDVAAVTVVILLPIPPDAINSIEATVSGLVREPTPQQPNIATWP
jgi:uncharacterized repeat protein (TIGR01451 family)